MHTFITRCVLCYYGHFVSRLLETEGRLEACYACSILSRIVNTVVFYGQNGKRVDMLCILPYDCDVLILGVWVWHCVRTFVLVCDGLRSQVIGDISGLDTWLLLALRQCICY